MESDGVHFFCRKQVLSINMTWRGERGSVAATHFVMFKIWFTQRQICLCLFPLCVFSPCQSRRFLIFFFLLPPTSLSLSLFHHHLPVFHLFPPSLIPHPHLSLSLSLRLVQMRPSCRTTAVSLWRCSCLWRCTPRRRTSRYAFAPSGPMAFSWQPHPVTPQTPFVWSWMGAASDSLST